MCSRILFRSIQHPLPLFIHYRFLSLSQVQSAAITNLKETSTSTFDLSSTKANESVLQNKTNASSTLSKNVSSDMNKTYAEKIQQIANEISKLSLVELMDLNELLKKKEEEEDEGARPTSQSVFKVCLIKFDEAKKVPVIKQVKEVVENINLVQARKLVESSPQVIRDNLSKADAEVMKEKIEAAGGVCTIE